MKKKTKLDDWHSVEFVKNWDKDPISGNPTRAEQIDILLSILEDEYRPGTTILDIGIGSGIVERTIFQRLPKAKIIGVDFSPTMVGLAHKHLEKYKEQYQIVLHDISESRSPVLPKRKYQIAISIQTLHNLNHKSKKHIFSWLHRILQKGGALLILDRIALNTPKLFSVYQGIWKRLERLHGGKISSADSFAEYIAKTKAKGDLPATLEEHLLWLRKAGFQVACVHLHAHRALFVARKL